MPFVTSNLQIDLQRKKKIWKRQREKEKKKKKKGFSTMPCHQSILQSVNDYVQVALLNLHSCLH